MTEKKTNNCRRMSHHRARECRIHDAVEDQCKMKYSKLSESDSSIRLINNRHRKSRLSNHHPRAPNDIYTVIDDLFNKHYPFKNDSYKLPHPDALFKGSSWSIPKLQELKEDLNNVKSRLNNYQIDIWHIHTSLRNKAGEVQWNLKRHIEPEFLTQAWCKFYENLSSFDVVPASVRSTNKFTSVHLCEAPGAFITSLNHWLKINMPGVQWDWLAMSLNPYYEGNSSMSVISDDRFIIYTLDHWFFGTDDTGDLMSLENVDALARKAQSKGDVMLVTADGSVDCLRDPGEQESMVAFLHFCEVVTALSILDEGGTLVLKIFTIFEHQTICLVYLLVCMFGEVHAKKPATSKEGNSENYLVCLGFKGRTFAKPYMEKLRDHFKYQFKGPIFELKYIPDSFIDQVVECGVFFKESQCRVIMDNISTFRPEDPRIPDETLKKIRSKVSSKFIEKYNLRRLNQEDKIVQDSVPRGLKSLNWSNKKFVTDSYNGLCKKRDLNMYNRLSELVTNMKGFEITGRSSTHRFTQSLCELSIQEGKPYDRILNSKFCYSEVLHEFQQFNETTSKLKLELNIPSNEAVKQFNQGLPEADFSSSTVLTFSYTSKKDSWCTIQKICCAMKETIEEKNLIMYGFCLLNRFNVGLLYILAHTFESLELQWSRILGCVIFLRNRKSIPAVMDKLDQIFNAAKAASERENCILSVIPMSVLIDFKFYPAVVDMNSWVINYCITNTEVTKFAEL